MGVNHGLHFLVAFFTCGLWLPGWIAIAFANRANPFRCTACGMPEEAVPPRRASLAWVWIVAATVVLTVAPVVLFWPRGARGRPRGSWRRRLRPGEPAPEPETAGRGMATPAPAEEPPVSAEEAAQRRAVARYPELGVAGSPLNREFLRRVQQYRAERPDFFANPEWPTELARECAGAAAAVYAARGAVAR